MLLALAGSPRSPDHPCARRRHAPRRGRRGHRQGPDARDAFRPRGNHPRARRRDGLQGLRFPRRGLPVHGHGRHEPGRRPKPSASRSPTAPSRPPAPRFGATSPAAPPSRSSSSKRQNTTTRDLLSPDSIHNALVTHAAFGGSTNLTLHIPAIAHAAGLPRPTVDDWARINRSVPRLVDVLPNGPKHYATVQVFLAGGVPEVMLHLRDAGLLKLDARTVTGRTLGENLAWWETSERRTRLRAKLTALDGIDPDDVIMSPTRARERGLTSTITFLRGNLAPEGALVKSTAIAPDVIGADGVYLHEGPARVFTTEARAIAALKSGSVKAGDTMVLIGLGPGIGMPETYQITSALKYVKEGKRIALITDGRFSGVSTGACLGHVSARSLGRRPHRQSPQRRPHPRPHRHAQTRRLRRRPRHPRRRIRRAPHAPRSHDGPARPRRHAPLGRAPKRQRRPLGRLRLRRGRNRKAPQIGARLVRALSVKAWTSRAPAKASTHKLASARASRSSTGRPCSPVQGVRKPQTSVFP